MAGKVKWTKEMEDVLVELWEQHPSVFDVSCKAYHDRLAKARGWLNIAQGVGVDGKLKTT